MTNNLEATVDFCLRTAKTLGYVGANVPNHVSFLSAQQFAEEQGADEIISAEFAWLYATHKQMVIGGMQTQKKSLREAWNEYNRVVK